MEEKDYNQQDLAEKCLFVILSLYDLLFLCIILTDYYRYSTKIGNIFAGNIALGQNMYQMRQYFSPVQPLVTIPYGIRHTRGRADGCMVAQRGCVCGMAAVLAKNSVGAKDFSESDTHENDPNLERRNAPTG